MFFLRPSPGSERLTPVFPPTAASTIASSVVGHWITGTPRLYTAAAKPARAPTIPPPIATTGSCLPHRTAPLRHRHHIHHPLPLTLPPIPPQHLQIILRPCLRLEDVTDDIRHVTQHPRRPPLTAPPEHPEPRPPPQCLPVHQHAVH